MQPGDFQLGVTLPLEKAQTEDGDLIIEGLAADYSPDRAGEAFAPGVFRKSIDKYLASGGTLCYHHKKDMQLGQVIRLEEQDGKGLLMKAVIPKPLGGNNPLADVYNKVKRGMMRGLSVFGTCTRERAADGSVRIVDVDLQEISVTPQQFGPNALLSVAQKAFPEDFGSPELSADELRQWFNERAAKLERELG
jgi:HK97 family phage prohead protease